MLTDRAQAPERGWGSHFFRYLDLKLKRPEASPFLPLFLCLIPFLVLALAFSVRPLWYDELLTYYIATAPDMPNFWQGIFHLDLNPPLLHVLTRGSMALFGTSPLATRLPSIAAYVGASFLFFELIRARLGPYYGLAGVLAFWQAGFVRYAAEVRPYALLVFFLCLAMVSWQRAANPSGSRKASLFWFSIGIWGMLMSHAYGTLLILLLGIAELARWIELRRPDWPMLGAFCAPTPFLLIYIPLLKSYGASQGAVPPAFQASWAKAIEFYADTPSTVSYLLAVVLSVVAATRSDAPHGANKAPLLRHYELILVLSLAAQPVILNALLMLSGGSFFPRYGIPSAVAFALIVVYFIASQTGSSRVSGAVASIVLFAAFVTSWFVYPFAERKQPPMVKPITFDRLDSQLPIVLASGLTFLEMNQREQPALLSRVFYLTDRDAAVQYAHATIFEGFGNLNKYVKLRGRVTTYADFVARHPNFYILCTLGYPEDWLVPKLMDDGAKLTLIGALPADYKDSTIFEISTSETRPETRKSGH